MKYLVTIETSGTMVFEIDSNLIDTVIFDFETWARKNTEEICRYYNPIKDRVNKEVVGVTSLCSKQEAYEILADDLSYKDDGTALGREQRLKYLKMLKPQE